MRTLMFALALFLIGGTSFSSAAAAEVKVKFQSEPSGASVIVDGELVCWETPCSKTLSKGKHRIIMQIEHYRPKYKDMKIKRARKILFVLKPEFGRLTVNTRPDHTMVRVNGLKVGNTPLKNHKLRPGKYEIILGSDCDIQVKRKVKIRLLKTSKIRSKVKTKKSKLKVAVRNKEGESLEATLFVDDENLGETPKELTVSACAKALKVEKEGYLPYEATLDLTEGETRKLDLLLEAVPIPEPEEPAEQEEEVAPVKADRYRVGFGNSPGLGNLESALVTIVVFSDFECSHCGKAEKMMDKILESYPKKVRLYFRNNPLAFHKHAMNAAKATLAVREQKRDKYWDMHRLLFENQGALAYEDLAGYAKRFDLDMKKFSMDMLNVQLEDEIYHDMQIAKKAGVRGTPTFFINGKKVVGSKSFTEMKEIIAEAIREAESFGKLGDELYFEITK